jgi:hypothetical protein
MRRSLSAAVLFVAAAALAPIAAAEGVFSERPSLAFEATGLAYGLAVGSPRVSAEGSWPISKSLCAQVSPTAAWGSAGDLELGLPIVLRGAIQLGPFAPYAGAGIEAGWGRAPAAAGIAALGPILEIGERFYMFKTGLFLEPYAGGALMFAWYGAGDPLCTPSAYGGLRIGFGF